MTLVLRIRFQSSSVVSTNDLLMIVPALLISTSSPTEPLIGQGHCISRGLFLSNVAHQWRDVFKIWELLCDVWVDVLGDHRHPVLGQQAGGRASDAARSAGDNRNLALEIIVQVTIDHGLIPLCSPIDTVRIVAISIAVSRVR